jgi:hypothetical protein
MSREFFCTCHPKFSPQAWPFTFVALSIDYSLSSPEVLVPSYGCFVLISLGHMGGRKLKGKGQKEMILESSDFNLSQ